MTVWSHQSLLSLFTITFKPFSMCSYCSILYIYCPAWRETRRFVPPRKFMSPEGDTNFLGGTNLRVFRLTGQLIVYYTESCSTTLYSTERCAVRHDRETRRLEGNTTICSPSTWLLKTNHISLFVISIIWGIIILFDSLLPIYNYGLFRRGTSQLSGLRSVISDLRIVMSPF